DAGIEDDGRVTVELIVADALLRDESVRGAVHSPVRVAKVHALTRLRIAGRRWVERDLMIHRRTETRIGGIERDLVFRAEQPPVTAISGNPYVVAVAFVLDR